MWAPQPCLAAGVPPRGHSGLNPSTRAPPSCPRVWSSGQIFSLPTSSCSRVLSIAKGPVQHGQGRPDAIGCVELLLEPPTCMLGPSRHSTAGRAPIKAAGPAANLKTKQNKTTKVGILIFFLMSVQFFQLFFWSMTRIKTMHTGEKGQHKAGPRASAYILVYLH